MKIQKSLQIIQIFILYTLTDKHLRKVLVKFTFPMESLFCIMLSRNGRWFVSCCKTSNTQYINLNMRSLRQAIWTRHQALLYIKKKKEKEKKGKVTHSWKKICTSVAPHFLNQTQKHKYAKHNDGHRKEIKPDIKIKMKMKNNKMLLDLFLKIPLKLWSIKG